MRFASILVATICSISFAGPIDDTLGRADRLLGEDDPGQAWEVLESALEEHPDDARLSVKLGEGAEWESSRYGSPRWFQYWSAADLDRELKQAALRPVFSSEEESASSTWLVRLCRAE